MPTPAPASALLPPNQQATALLVKWEQRTRPTGRTYATARPNLLRGLTEICTRLYSGADLNVDAEDLRSVLAGAKTWAIAQGQASGLHRAATTVQQALASLAIQPRWQPTGAAWQALLSISSSAHAELEMDELVEITETVQHHLGSDAEMIFGHGHHPEPTGHGLRLWLLVSYA